MRGHEEHEGDKEEEANLMEPALDPLTDWLATHRLDEHEEDSAAVERGKRDNIDDAEIDTEYRREEEQVGQPKIARLSGVLRDTDRPRYIGEFATTGDELAEPFEHRAGELIGLPGSLDECLTDGILDDDHRSELDAD